MIKRADEMRVEVRENMKGAPGAISIIHCIEKEELTANTRLCSRLVLPPGAGIGEHVHATEDEVFIVTKGSGLVNEGDGDVRVNTGDAILTGKGGAHSVMNDGDEDLEMIAVIMCY